MTALLRKLPVGETGRWWVYLHLAADGSVLYVGCTIRPRHRQYEHRRRSPWWAEVADIQVIGPWRVHRAALDEEANLIEFFDPAHNLRHTERESEYYSKVRRAYYARSAARREAVA
jgi:excinuclease UvrABC nuclease subunit